MRLPFLARNLSTADTDKTVETQSVSDMSAVSEMDSLSNMSGVVVVNSANAQGSQPAAIKPSAALIRSASLRALPDLRGRLWLRPPAGLRRATSDGFRAYGGAGGKSNRLSDDHIAPHLTIVLSKLNYLIGLHPETIDNETLVELTAFDNLDFGEDYLQSAVVDLIEGTNQCFAHIHDMQFNNRATLLGPVRLPIKLQKKLTELMQTFCDESENKLDVIDALQVALSEVEQKIADVTQDARYNPLSREQSESVRAVYDRLEPKESSFFQLKFSLSQYRRALVAEVEGVKKADAKLFYAKFGEIKEALNYLGALDEPRLGVPMPQKGILLALKDIVTAHAIHKGSEDASHAESTFYLLNEEHKALVNFCTKYTNNY